MNTIIYMNFWQNVNIQDSRVSPSWKNWEWKRVGACHIHFENVYDNLYQIDLSYPRKNTQEAIDVRDVASICT